MLYGKPYITISKQDVINNEGDILYEIKKAIVYGATKQLYYDINQYKSDDGMHYFYNVFNNKKVDKPSQEDIQDLEHIKFYFEDLVI